MHWAIYNISCYKGKNRKESWKFFITCFQQFWLFLFFSLFVGITFNNVFGNRLNSKCYLTFSSAFMILRTRFLYSWPSNDSAETHLQRYTSRTVLFSGETLLDHKIEFTHPVIFYPCQIISSVSFSLHLIVLLRIPKHVLPTWF